MGELKIMVYIHNGILINHKKKDILPHVTMWMDLKGIMLSEVSQTEKDKYCVISATHICIYLLDAQNGLMISKDGRDRGEKEWTVFSLFK